MSKKATKNTKEFKQYDVGDPVLGKVRGYPPWPGIVVDPAEVPPAVVNDQPPGKRSSFHCVLFFPMGDYAWLHPKDLSTLKRHEIEAFLADETKKRNGELREGYKIALDPSKWISDLNEARVSAAQQEQEEEEDAQVDQLESEHDGGDDGGSTKKAKASTTKKRKRDSDAEPVKTKKAPKAKKGSAEPTKKKSASTAAKKKNGTKSKTMVESEDEGDHGEAEEEDEDAGPSKKTSPPPAKKAKRDKDDDGDDSKTPGDPQSVKVRDWRHKLQKTFLSNKSLPKAEAMQEIDQLFTMVEKYDEMTIEQLQFSKIGKVMRHIAALTEDKISRDDEYKFRARAKDLVDKWHQILNANKPAHGSPDASGVGQTNGKAEKKGKDEDEVTQGTKNLDLNGKEGMEGFPAAPMAVVGGEDAPADTGDTSMLGDVTMSEA